MGFLSKLFDPGKGNRDAAGRLIDSAQVTGGSASGPGGIGAGFNFDASGRGSINSSLGSFDPFLSALQAQAGAGFNFGSGGLPSFLTGAFDSSTAALQAPNLQSFGNVGGASALQGILQNSAGLASANPFALGAATTDQLRQRSTRSNQNAVNKTFDRLFASGGLANQTTREQVTGDLSRQLDEQDLGFQLAGLEQGRAIQGDAFGRTQGAFGGLEAFGARGFGEQLAGAQLGGQFANQRFGLAQGLQQAQMQQMQVGQGLGLQALQGATGLSQLPLSFLSAGLQAQGLRSDAALGGAAGQSKLASQASSPLLGALGAVGQFGSAIGGFGGLGAALGMFGGGGKPNVGTNFGGFSGGLDVSHLLQGIQQ